MVVYINEAGRDGQAPRVNCARRRAFAEPPDGRNLPVANADIGDERRIARAVHDAAIANENVEVRRLSVPASEQREQQNRNRECPLHHFGSILLDRVSGGKCTAEQILLKSSVTGRERPSEFAPLPTGRGTDSDALPYTRLQYDLGQSNGQIFYQSSAFRRKPRMPT